MADFSPYLQWVVAVFMMLFGINFNLYFLVLIGRGRQALKSEELRTYLGVIAAATLLIVLNTRAAGVRLGETVRHAFFQVSSIITTTGFATCDFDLWPSLSKCVLVLLMLVGACAGSTGGGIKISRVLILIKRAGEELHKFIFPNSITKIRLEKKILDREVVHTTSAFLIVYVFIFAISTLLVSAEGPMFLKPASPPLPQPSTTSVRGFPSSDRRGISAFSPTSQSMSSSSTCSPGVSNCSQC